MTFEESAKPTSPAAPKLDHNSESGTSQFDRSGVVQRGLFPGCVEAELFPHMREHESLRSSCLGEGTGFSGGEGAAGGVVAAGSGKQGGFREQGVDAVEERRQVRGWAGIAGVAERRTIGRFKPQRPGGNVVDGRREGDGNATDSDRLFRIIFADADRRGEAT